MAKQAARVLKQFGHENPDAVVSFAGAEQIAPPVTTPWGDRNARVAAPDGMQLTLFTLADEA